MQQEQQVEYGPSTAQVFAVQPGVQADGIWREVALLHRCLHPRIVPIHGVAVQVRAVSCICPTLSPCQQLSCKACNGCQLAYPQSAYPQPCPLAVVLQGSLLMEGMSGSLSCRALPPLSLPPRKTHPTLCCRATC